jgi:hypothetical protein
VQQRNSERASCCSMSRFEEIPGQCALPGAPRQARIVAKVGHVHRKRPLYRIAAPARRTVAPIPLAILRGFALSQSACRPARVCQALPSDTRSLRTGVIAIGPRSQMPSIRSGKNLAMTMKG